MRKLLLAIALIAMLLISVGLILSAFELGPFEPPSLFEFPEVYILSDGTVKPAYAPINSDGNFYTLEADLEVEELYVEKSNIILDGNGFSFTSPVIKATKGGPIYGESSITVLNTENVTLRNLSYIHKASVTFENSSSCKVTDSNISIAINNSHNIIVSNMKECGVKLTNSRTCTVSSCELYRVTLKNSQQNMVLNNNMTGFNWLALIVEDSNSNLFFGNSIERAVQLFNISGSSGSNLFVGNYIRGAFSIDPILNCGGVNTFYHNNFVYVYWNRTVTDDTFNLWDNGFEGNYWNDYQGEDVNGDGIGDTPHFVDDNNQDRYPLMNPLDLSIEPMPKFP